MGRRMVPPPHTPPACFPKSERLYVNRYVCFQLQGRLCDSCSWRHFSSLPRLCGLQEWRQTLTHESIRLSVCLSVCLSAFMTKWASVHSQTDSAAPRSSVWVMFMTSFLQPTQPTQPTQAVWPGCRNDVSNSWINTSLCLPVWVHDVVGYSADRLELL